MEISSQNVAEHLTYMQELCVKPLQAIANDLRMAQYGLAIPRLKNNSETSLSAFYIKALNEETIYADNNSPYPIHRAFILSSEGGEYSTVGWVIEEDVHHCMRCRTLLPTNRSKLHCYACGDIVCETCGQHSANILELHSVGKFLVCTKCFQGDHVTISVKKPRKNANKVVKANQASTNIQKNSKLKDKQLSMATKLATATNLQSTENAELHLKMIRTLSKKTLFEVIQSYDLSKSGRAMIQRRGSLQEAFVVSRITKEIFYTDKLRTRSTSLYRVYLVSTSGGEYCAVGWIISESASHCMRCLSTFGFLLSRHHCVACGDIICTKCSPKKAIIAELRSDIEHRVCEECFGAEANNAAAVMDVSAYTLYY
jgi:hypothetical protein